MFTDDVWVSIASFLKGETLLTFGQVSRACHTAQGALNANTLFRSKLLLIETVLKNIAEKSDGPAYKWVVNKNIQCRYEFACPCGRGIGIYAWGKYKLFKTPRKPRQLHVTNSVHWGIEFFKTVGYETREYRHTCCNLASIGLTDGLALHDEQCQVCQQSIDVYRYVFDERVRITICLTCANNPANLVRFM